MSRVPFFKVFKTFLAVLYLLLSMAAAWHHHEAPPGFAGTVQMGAASAASGHAVDADGFCALCSWQSLQQEAASALPAAAVFQSLTEISKPPAFVEPAPGFSQAAWARGPPCV